MTINENEILVKNTANNEFSNVQELLKGFDRAVITHAFKEQPGSPGNLQMCKMVILYNQQEMSFEDVVRGAGDIMKFQFFNLVKSSVFNIVGNFLKETSIDYKALLFRTVFGFTPNPETVIDKTEYFNQYLKGEQNENI